VDIGIKNERIVQIGEDLKAAAVLDAQGMYVFPGGIDAHVHLSHPGGDEDEPGWVDDFASGSAAALAGGITTLGNMTFPQPGETPLESIKREQAQARDQTITDLFLHPVLLEAGPETLAEIPRLLEEGCNSIKIFMVMPDFDSSLASFRAAIRIAGENGLISLIHCEDHALISQATDELVRQGKSSLRYFAESRPVESEVIATQVAVDIGEETGAVLYIVHLSSARALQVCKEAQERNVSVYVETRPLYLYLTQDRFQEQGGAKYVGQPPLREREDIRVLWAGMKDETVHTLCTDHAPWSLAAKLDPRHTLENLRPGVANLQTMLPMLYSEGVRNRKITLQQFVKLTSSNAAKLFGLYPRKGHIGLGSDADLVIFDPHRTRIIEPSFLKSKSDYSVYEGWRVTGWPVVTIRRGEIVFQEDHVIGKPGSGELLHRKATMALH
jgi:dihydropyrimidinase